MCRVVGRWGIVAAALPWLLSAAGCGPSAAEKQDIVGACNVAPSGLPLCADFRSAAALPAWERVQVSSEDLACIEDRGCDPAAPDETLPACLRSNQDGGSFELFDDGLTPEQEVRCSAGCSDNAQLTETDDGEACDAAFVERVLAAYDACKSACFDCERRFGDIDEGEVRSSDDPAIQACLDVWQP
jgi:hypothetical protein